jgi:hypothetical protein
MAYNPVPTVATGDLWTASNHNTYIRDNFAAGVPDIFTAAGDLAIASGANAATNLPIGSSGQVLQVIAGLPAWNGADGCLVRKSTAQSISNNVLPTAISSFDIESWDYNSYHSGSDGYITVPETGIYTVQVGAFFTGHATVGTKRAIYVGTPTLSYYSVNSYSQPDGSYQVDMIASFTGLFNAGQQLTCLVAQLSGSAININAPYLTIARIK